ncbi:MAG: hypothetical protein E7628_00985 [Ruminococcaceae bacterium]|nr:hypothetical protein [Oscillospiraceae bacterium]
MREQHTFSENYDNKKRAILDALNSTEEPKTYPNYRIAVKLIAVAAIISVLTIGVFAAVKLANFAITQDDDGIRIHASLPEKSESDDEVEENKPLRSWNIDDGGVGAKLIFGYMPEDITENATTPYKYSNEEFTRALTFTGYDLRRSDFDEVLSGAASYKSIDTGANKAYIVYGKSEVSFYDRMLYILFEDEDLLVSVYVSYGITDEELTMIVENLSVVETYDTAEAMPIGNEFGTNSGETQVYYYENPPEYYSDLLKLGETGTDESVYHAASVTVNSIDYYDSLAGFDYGNIINMDFVKKFIDDRGNLIEYYRTEIIRGDGETTVSKYGENVPMTKKFITVTLTLDYEYMGDADLGKFDYEPPYLHTFSLGGIVILDDGEVRFREGDYDINKTPGTHAVSHDPVYREYLGNNTWILGYLIDTDELDGELYFFSDHADIGYALK